MKSIFTTTRLTLMALLLLSVSAFGQVPASGATDVAITTNYTIPAGAPGLVDGTIYDLVVLNGTSTVQIGVATTFTYVAATGNTVAGPTLINYSDYNWRIILTGENAVTPPSGVKYGSYNFITIGPTVTLTISGGSTIAEDGGTTNLLVTASAAIGKDLAVTVTYTGTVDNSLYGTDFTNTGGANPETITILAGNLTQPTTLTGVADAFLEGDETIIGTITAVASGVIGGSAQTVTITDAEYIEVIASNATIAEAGGITGFSAQVSGSGTNETGGLITVNIDWTQGSATSGTDFTGASDMLIAIGSSSSSTTSISITSDNLLEGDENIGVKITGLTGTPVGTGYSSATATTTITDDEQASLVSPTHTATGQSLAPVLTWNDMLGADQYILEVYVDNGGSPGTSVFNKTNIADAGSGNQSYTLTTPDSPLADNTTYHWRVAAKNTSIPVTSSYSGYYTFTTSQQGLTGTTVTDGSVNVSLTPTLNWDTVTGADKYLLKVGTTSGGTDILNNLDVGSSTSYTFTSALTNNTNYYWSVTAQNATGALREGEIGVPIQTSAEMTFRTLLATPVLSSPANGSSTTDRTPTLSWTMAASTSGVTYDIDYTFNGGSATTITTASSGSTTSYTFPSDLALGRYTWNVKANDGTGLSSTFNTSKTSTSTYTLDVTPTLVAPVNGLTGVPIEPKFQWNDGGAIDYTIQITTTSGDYSSPVAEKTVNNVTSYQMLETDTGMPLNNNTVYYWRIKISAGGGNFLYSPEWQFKTWPNMTITHGWPTSGATVYTTSTTFSWAINAATGSMKYKPQVVASTTTPTTTGWAAATLTTTTTSLTTSFSLNGGTQYYWRLVVLNSSSQVVAYSTPTTFTTSGGATVNLYPSWPTGGATVYSTTPMAYWYLDVYATGLTYQIRYATDAAVTSGELSHMSAANYPTSTGSFSSNQYITFPTLTAGTTYYWQVRAYYATTTSYSSWSSVESFTVNNTNAVVIPTPSYPTGGVTVYTSSPYLYWYLGTNATGLTYEIDYALTGTGVDGTADQTGITNLYYQLSGLTAGSTYEWRVRSNNGSTTSNWSSTVTFVVDGGVSSSSAVASWPTGNPTVYSTKPTLSWYLNGSSSGITGYKVKYSTTDPGSSSAWNSLNPGTPDATDGEVTISGSSTTTWTATADLTYGQKYYWAVASWDGSSAGTYSSDSFTIVGGSTAGTPILSSPIGGVTVYSSSQTLYWYFNGTTTGIQSYDIHYSKDGFLTTNVNTSSTTTSVSLTGLTPGATYSWKVRAFYGGSTYGSYSSTETFVVDAGAAPVQPLIGGPNNVTITTSSPVVSWVLPVQSESNLSYELVYSTSEDMSSVQTIEGIQSPFAPIDGLEAGKTYYWKVRSKTNSGNYSDYSTRASFSTDQTTEVKEETVIPDKFVVDQNYPNPFNPSTIIKFGIPNGEFVSVRIYNMLGQEVRTLVSGNMNAGTYELTWNGKDNSGNSVTSGAYIYRIVAGNNAVTKKMMLLK